MKSAVAIVYLLASFGLAQVIFAGVMLYFDVVLNDAGLLEWLVAGIIAVVCAVVFLRGAMEYGKGLANRSLR